VNKSGKYQLIPLINASSPSLMIKKENLSIYTDCFVRANGWKNKNLKPS